MWIGFLLIINIIYEAPTKIQNHSFFIKHQKNGKKCFQRHEHSMNKNVKLSYSKVEKKREEV